MSLAALLASSDDDALAALTSKGVLIRAKKDVDAGKVTLSAQEKDSATFNVAGEVLTLNAKSLDTARCTCPATGICRHIVAAVIFLRDQAEVTTDAGPVPLDFTLQEIEKFAGKDWPAACGLAEEAQVPDTKGTVIASFAESAAKVTFPNGGGLRDAIYKGPVAAHKRRSIAAAALAVARANGAALPEIVAQTSAPYADAGTLDRITAALEMAAISLAAGTFAQAQAHLFNIAVDTRAEAIPRIAAELRGLSKNMDPEALRTASVTPTDLLGGIARSYALAEALRLAPDDPALVGVLARTFAPSGPKSLAFVGAEIWQTPAGARGLTMMFSDLEDGTIYRAVQARAAGTDLTFNPMHQWTTTLWSLAKPSAMAGRTITLPDAAIAGDNGLGLNQTAIFGAAIGLGDLLGVQTDWQELHQAVRHQLGEGLRQRAGDALIILKPDSLAGIGFDGYAQVAVWDWMDANGSCVTLKLPDDPGLRAKLAALVRRIKAGLVAFPPGGGLGRLLSVWMDDAGPLCLGLDQLPKPKGVGAMMDRFLERAIPRAESEIAPLDPLALYFERALEAVATNLSGRAGLPQSLVSDAQSLGLGQVLAADEAWRADKDVRAALRLAYVLSAGRDLARGER
ncbi:SWIM zinc finger family protein [Thalassococcus sp. S3]|uniref:SWIM zinc finger family protein n=1 Tax=Thalassococcus sp. S3 TaxID=2017482 RepID=UPI0010246796|nr:SWIM zinc finger family protein [Thalassococcus sp. S3]QBF33426.1 hypothetical protein CFI11_19750 [Thalassococcus sp. S3]